MFVIAFQAHIEAFQSAGVPLMKAESLFKYVCCFSENQALKG